MMTTVRKSNQRGHAQHGWLDSYHTFSFADYYDPKHTHYRNLRVINEDRVAPEMGFGMHPHRDMEIISYIIKGELRHQDSMGNTATMKAGDIQRISAGKGILHSEVNSSTSETAHFLQIWIMPDEKGVTPRYEEKSFSAVETGKLHLIASKSGAASSIPINQDANLYLGKLKKGDAIQHSVSNDRHIWIQLIEGKLNVNDTEIDAGDGVSLEKVDSLKLTTPTNAHFLVFDLN